MPVSSFEVADITRYDIDPTLIDCVTPMPYGHLVYYTDHELVVEHLLSVIRKLEIQNAQYQTPENATNGSS